ncbi:MAG: hypothetical protein H0U92_14460 [Actinobacteria bacterium]|nr:hypothetical protein [Actinomycetota bacterium]
MSDDMSAGAVASTVAKLRPLLFGAAFKVIDLTLEVALARAGHGSRQPGRWTIAEKVGLARLYAGDLPPVSDTFQDGWQRLCSLYAGWEEVRHSLVHRAAAVDVATGQLVGKDRAGNSLVPVSAADQEQFARIAVEMFAAVSVGVLTARNRRRLACRLNRLMTHHGHGVLADEAAPGTAIHVLASLERLPNDSWKIDAQTAFDRARGVFQEATEFNGKFVASTSMGDRVFHCMLEDAPSSAEFDLDDPPDLNRPGFDGDFFGWCSHAALA